MAKVDPDDDAVRRYVVRQYRYDPHRRERRHVVVAAFDDQQEYEQCFRATSEEIQRRKSAGEDVDAREHVSGIVLEPGDRERAANGRLLMRAMKRGVPLGPWADELELPSYISFVRSYRDSDPRAE